MALRTLALAAVTGLCLIAAVPANAGPILGPIWEVDTPDSAVVGFAAPQGVQPNGGFFQLGPFLSPSRFWRVQILELLERDAVEGEDRVTVNFTFQHVMGPHGEGLGPIFSETLMIRSLTTLENPDESMDLLAGQRVRRGPVTHAGGTQNHQDFFVGLLLGVVDRDTRNINSYSLTLAINHRAIPEPATLSLVGLGTIWLGYGRLRVRRRGDDGRAEASA